MLMFSSEMKNIAQFQVGYMSLPGINQKTISQYHTQKFITTAFTTDTFKYIKKVLINQNHIFSLLTYTLQTQRRNHVQGVGNSYIYIFVVKNICPDNRRHRR